MHAPAELPECPQLWPRLVALDLSHNSLGGAVPEAALASMTALQTLDMSFQASSGFRGISKASLMFLQAATPDCCSVSLVGGAPLKRSRKQLWLTLHT